MFIVFAVTLLDSNPAFAVRNIRNLSWGESSRVKAADAAAIQIRFDADLSYSELYFGSTSFSLVVLRPGRPWAYLMRYSVGPVMDPPPHGTPARIQLEIGTACNLNGAQLRPTSGASSVEFLHHKDGWVARNLSPYYSAPVIDVWETFGLGLMDDQGNIAELIPGAALSCENKIPGASVGVYFDAAGTLCEGSIAAGERGTIYVVAKYDANAAPGVAGAEFRIEGLPASWVAAPVPNPEILTIGNPFAGGVVTGFNCSVEGAGSYVLYTVTVFADQDEDDVTFTVEPRVPSMSVDCPLLVSCDAPVFSKVCVESTPCFVNSTKPTPCDFNVSVENQNWSGVKALYR